MGRQGPGGDPGPESSSFALSSDLAGTSQRGKKKKKNQDPKFSLTGAPPFQAEFLAI